MIERNEQDREIQRALQDDYHRIKVPDPTPSWEKVRIQLKQRRRLRKIRSRVILVAGVITTALVINAISTVNISKTYAHMSSLVREVKEYLVEFFFTREEFDASAANTIQPIEGAAAESSALLEETTLEVAQTKMTFSLRIPKFMPDGYVLDVVRIFQEEDGQYRNAYLEYVTSDYQDIVKISQHLIEPRSTHVKSDVASGSGIVQEVWIDSRPGVLVIVPEGFVTLEWLTAEDIKVSISGKLTETEVIQVAESLN